MENSRNPDRDRSLTPDARRPRRFTSETLAHILREDLKLSPDVPLYVAYSGGMDSHVLLHAAASLRDSVPWRLAALHIDHGLQPNSSKWAAHCAQVCRALDVPCQSERVAVEGIADRGLEDAARRARYAALARLLPAAGVLLTAHHLTDQAETFLLQLLRGAGVPGLAAMAPISRFARGRVARPLLGVERAALAAYAAAHDLRWVEDASNRDTGPARNFLRARVWPTLTERWPRAARRIGASAGHQAQAAALLDELAALDLAAVGDGDELRIERLQTLSPARQVNLLRYWVHARTGLIPPETVLGEIIGCTARTPRTRHAKVRWSNAEVRRYRDRLVVRRAVAPAPPDWLVCWDPDVALDIPGIGWRLSAQAAIGAGLSRARVDGKLLQVRLRRGGETCRLHGHRREVKKLMQEAGIPPWERGHWPLVYVDGDLAAIGDRWVCEPYAARADEPGWMLMLMRNDAAGRDSSRVHP